MQTSPLTSGWIHWSGANALIQCGPGSHAERLCQTKSGWNYHLSTTGVNHHNKWGCRFCRGNWKGNTEGSRLLMIFAEDNIIQVIVGPPPLPLYKNWMKDRVEFYEKMEPIASPCKRLRFPSLNMPCKRMALTGQESELVWGVVMGPTDHSRTAVLHPCGMNSG